MVAIINDESFDPEVLGSDVPVVVDFFGPQCKPCIPVGHIVEELAAEYQGVIKFVKIDASQNRKLCLKTKVMALPTLLLFKQGQEVGRLSGGDLSEQEIRRLIME